MVHFLAGSGIFLYSEMPSLALGPNQPPTEWADGGGSFK